MALRADQRVLTMLDNFNEHAPHLRVDDDYDDLARGTRTMALVLLALGVLVLLGVLIGANL